MKYVFSAVALVAIVASVSCSPREESAPEQADSRNACTAPAPETAPILIEAKDASIEVLIQELNFEGSDEGVAMAELARRREAAIPALIEAIGDENAILRRWALRTFWLMRPAPDPGSAIPTIANAMTDADSEVRYRAARALERFGPKAKAAVPEMIEILKDQQSDILLRNDAIRVLHCIGPGAKGALGVLVKALDDKDTSVRNGSIGAIMAVGGTTDPSMIPRMMELLDDEETTSAAGWFLRDFGKAPLTPVRALMEDESPKKRKSALSVLGGMGATGRKVLPDVVKMLSDKAPEVRVQACAAIVEIDPPGKLGLDKLLEFINDPEFESRETAIDCWSRINRKGADAIPGLVNALEDRRLGVRIAATNALGGLGPLARGVLPAVKAAFYRERDRFVRRGMSNAIKYIGGEEWDPVGRERSGDDITGDVRGAMFAARAAIEGKKARY